MGHVKRFLKIIRFLPRHLHETLPGSMAPSKVRQTSKDLADPRRRAAPSMNSWSLTATATSVFMRFVLVARRKN